jgi:hypothetical protein
MSGFDFGAAVGADAQAYTPPTQDVLPSGNYIVTVTSLENTTSSGGYPMLKLTLDNAQGRQWDNLVISPNEFSVQKLLGLIDAAGIARPDPEAGEISTQDGRLADAYASKLEGKTVGLVVRDEEDNREDHRGEVRPRVKGYVPQDVIAKATQGPLASAEGNGSADESKLAF